MKRIVVVGDSDIANWPQELLPSPTDGSGDGENVTGIDWDDIIVSGHSGATLAGVVPHLQSSLFRLQTNIIRNGRKSTKSGKSHGERDTLIVVACAGENDIGEGVSLGKSVEALQDFVGTIFRENEPDENRFLIFLGPKFEPWLEHDPLYKKNYEAMARAFRRCLEDYQITTTFHQDKSVRSTEENHFSRDSGDNRKNGSIHFIDCLTMFCGETASLPGARLGGRARADPRFFSSDQLHLSNEGYAVWKDAVEITIQQCIV